MCAYVSISARMYVLMFACLRIFSVFFCAVATAANKDVYKAYIKKKEATELARSPVFEIGIFTFFRIYKNTSFHVV